MKIFLILLYFVVTISFIYFIILSSMIYYFSNRGKRLLGKCDLYYLIILNLTNRSANIEVETISLYNKKNYIKEIAAIYESPKILANCEQFFLSIESYLAVAREQKKILKKYPFASFVLKVKKEKELEYFS